jgi:hypothetical protein
MGEWVNKPLPVKGKNSRRRAAKNDAPKREARPYPSAPVTARPGSRIAVTVLRGNTDPGIPHLPYRRIGAEREVGRPLSKAEQANHVPFMPEFQAEGQPFPRVARDDDGNVTPRVRTDNGMTKQLQGRGIARRADGKSTYTKRQVEEWEREREARHATAMEVVRLRDIADTQERLREEAKRGLQHFMGIEREALARGDAETAEHARQSIRAYRKAAKYKG